MTAARSVLSDLQRALLEGRDYLLTPGEVASLFRVDPKTVSRWAKCGKLSSTRTLGGHRRFRATEVRDLLDGYIPAGQAKGTVE